MIKEFADAWFRNLDQITQEIKSGHHSYEGLVKIICQALAEDDQISEYDAPDPKRIVKIDHGDYQGTLVFVIGAHGYQPRRYWVTSVNYGSCSACDTLQAIRAEDDEDGIGVPDDAQCRMYLQLALNLLQRMKQIME